MIGYSFVHTTVDDHSRLAYSEVLAPTTPTALSGWAHARLRPLLER